MVQPMESIISWLFSVMDDVLMDMESNTGFSRADDGQFGNMGEM